MELSKIGSRIKYVRTHLVNMSQLDFSGLLSMTQTSLSMIENQKVLPGCFFLYRIHATFRIDLNWLIAGEGEPRPDPSQPLPRPDSGTLA